jgi:hypothetical protein
VNITRIQGVTKYPESPARPYPARLCSPETSAKKNAKIDSF